ncbi:TetR/AcrR family transcriptional regulator [Nocardioides ultimimeridianus]
MTAAVAGPQGPKERMILAAVELLRETGLGGVTIDAVLARSAAPRGSVYHHFPGGRDEILRSAAQRAGDDISALIERATAAGDATRVVVRFTEFWKRTLVASDFHAGCPVLALTVGSGPDSDWPAAMARDTYARWRSLLAGALEGSGVSADASGPLATTVIAAISGAVVMSSADRSTEPMDQVADQMVRLIRLASGA